MTFLRIIILLGFVYLGYRLARKLVHKHSDSKSSKTTRMVRCAFCNIYIVKDDALEKDNNYFCNSEHYEKSLRQKQND